MRNYTDKPYRTLFSKADLYHFADEIMSMYIRFKLILDLARMENDEVRINAYSGIVTELGMLVEGYGLKEMLKIE